MTDNRSPTPYFQAYMAPDGTCPTEQDHFSALLCRISPCHDVDAGAELWQRPTGRGCRCASSEADGNPSRASHLNSFMARLAVMGICRFVRYVGSVGSRTRHEYDLFCVATTFRPFRPRMVIATCTCTPSLCHPALCFFHNVNRPPLLLVVVAYQSLALVPAACSSRFSSFLLLLSFHRHQHWQESRLHVDRTNGPKYKIGGLSGEHKRQTCRGKWCEVLVLFSLMSPTLGTRSLGCLQCACCFFVSAFVSYLCARGARVAFVAVAFSG